MGVEEETFLLTRYCFSLISLGTYALRLCLVCVVDVRVCPRSSVGILEEALDLTVDLCTALFSTPSYLAPLCCSVFSLVCLFLGGHSHHDTQDVIMHVIPIAGSDPTSRCFLGVLVFCLLLLCVFCLLGCFCFWFAYRSTTSTFVAIDKLTAVHDNYNSFFCYD